MKFVDSAGTLGKGRRNPSGSVFISDDEVADKHKLAEIIRALGRRVSELEARTPPEAVEFEVITPAAGYVTITHGMGTVVRWYIVDWLPTSLGTAPSLELFSTTSDSITLYSASGGVAVVRVEQSQYKGLR